MKSVTSQKVLAAFLGFALFASVLTVGYVERQRKELKRPETAEKPLLDPKLERGRQLYKKFSCATCHGTDGKNGSPNVNAQTGQQVPPVAYVAESFTREELRKKILTGVARVEKKTPAGPTPPLYMPAYRDLLADSESEDLIDYLYSLKPKTREESW